MAPRSDTGTPGVAHDLKSLETKSLLRFITCGSVDDGKSTLIGRLLYESKMIFDDQLVALEGGEDLNLESMRLHIQIEG